MNNWDSKFFFLFSSSKEIKTEREKIAVHTHSTGWRSAARYFEDLFPSRRSLSFTTSSIVHMYDFYIFTVIYSLLHGFIWNKHNEHFPVSLVAQLIELWSGLRPYFHYYSNSVHYCEDRFHFRSAKDGEISHLGNVQTA